MDFDALAAQYAVSKLFPSVRMVVGHPLTQNIRSFLSLYRNNLPLVELAYIDLSQINHLFLVDCQDIERLSEVARKLFFDPKKPRTYTIFDHHQLNPNGLGPSARNDSIIRASGSATSLLVDMICKKKIDLSSFEATLLTMGIYEDTGSLSYSNTTELDAACTAYLLRCGADLAQVNHFIRSKLTQEQKQLFEKLLANSRILDVSGAQVVISYAKEPHFIEGLSTLTRQLVDVTSTNAAITAVHMKDRTHIVGRSDQAAIDVRLLAQIFGGDGHHGAAAAVEKKLPLSDIVTKIENFILSSAPSETKAKEIMISPVRTIRPETSMEEASHIMIRHNQDGLVVTNGNDLVGVISRRDVDKAKHHKLGHAPVTGFMSHPVITITPDSTLSEIQHLMVKNDIGRLPVVNNEKNLVGIVSRREVLQKLYGGIDQQANDTTLIKQTNSLPIKLVKELSRADTATTWLFQEIGNIANKLNMNVYAVGGFVRDLLLNSPNYDLDFVTEGLGSAIELANALASAHPKRFEIVATHDRFQTATLSYYSDINNNIKREVDISTARTEFYEYPAALPTVEASKLEHDLFRRDFTINALAICLNPSRYGEIVDYFDGLSDLKSRLVRVLHPFSFIEDPTRIVRAARFCARLNFRLEEKTVLQAKRAINMGIFDNLGGVRLREELRLILESKQRLFALDELAKLGGQLRYLDTELHYNKNIRRILRRAERLLSHYPIPNDWLVYLALLLSELREDRLIAVLDRLYLTNDAKDSIVHALSLQNNLAKQTQNSLKRSQIYNLMKEHSLLSLTIAACLADVGSQSRRWIKLYLEELKDVNTNLSGSDLLKMGFKQGPEIGSILNQLLEAKLDGIVTSKQDEVKLVQELSKTV
jgi:tRNA nucleotidyltransferase (CCA-adding enzyme)